MRTSLREQDYEKEAAKLVGQFPDRSHANLTIDVDTKVMAPDGIITAVLLCNVIPSKLHNLAYELSKPVYGRLGNRSTAVGTESLPQHTRKDGTLSEYRGVNERVLNFLKARQGMLGYRRCRKTPLTIKRPEMLDGNERLVKRVDELYAEHLPTFHAMQRAEVEKAPRCRLRNTAFSTIYVAKNLRTAYHPNQGNLLGVMTALMPMGKFTGGELVLVRWRIAIAFKPGDLLLFDPQQLHGNLPFEGERLSAAFYCDGGIADCGK
jgi:hypothetical protein